MLHMRWVSGVLPFTTLIGQKHRILFAPTAILTKTGQFEYNPIEHRLFPHVARACQGVVFHTIQIVKGLMEKTKTSTGLQVTVDILDKV